MASSIGERRCRVRVEVRLQDEKRQDGSRLTTSAYLRDDGRLVIAGQDLGPVTNMVSDDGEYEWSHTYAAADVSAVVRALGGREGDDVLLVLRERWAGNNRASDLMRTLRDSGVPYEVWTWP